MLLNTLIIDKKITSDQFMQAQSSEDPIETIKSMISMEDFINAVKKTYNVNYIDLESEYIENRVLSVVDNTTLTKYKIIPFKIVKNELYIATSEPNDFTLDSELKTKVAPLKIKKYYSEPSAIKKVLNQINDGFPRENIEKVKVQAQNTQNTSNTNSSPQDAVTKVNDIINRAIELNASDIHLEPIGDKIRIRMRVDGDLFIEDSISITPKEYVNIVSRIKVMSSMDPAEKRRSQDGKIPNYEHKKQVYDLRVSSMFITFGEKLVLRLINKQNSNSNFSNLGFDEKEVTKLNKLFSKDVGIILITGETGSGKSTTLYTALNRLNSPNTNICTVEDPVESEILGVAQVQVNELAGITFSSALRTFLRQDPDIVMVGEIRDTETAEIAIKAANTGHLVLSTIHTNNSTATVGRLVSMGIEHYKVAEGVIGIVSQKLVKRLCPNCKKVHKLTKSEEEFIKMIEEKYEIKLKDDETTFYESNENGCPECKNGYKGRLVVSEILELTDNVVYNIAQKLSSIELRKEVSKDMSCFIPFEVSGLNKAKRGLISISDAIRLFQ